MTISLRQFIGQFVLGETQLADQTERVLDSLRKTRAQLRARFDQLEGLTMTGFDRLNSSYEGLAGDVAALKASAVTLQTAVDTLTAGQDAAVAAGVTTALADFNTQLDVVAAKFEGLDAQTPAEPPAPPVV